MINDYATLQQAIASWLARADLSANIPDFIALGEARINRELRTRQMQALVTGAATGQTITLPADLRAVQALYVSVGGYGQEIRPLPATALAERPPGGTGYPEGYVVVGSTAYLIGGSGNLSYTLTYSQALPTLVSNQNWLIQREPGLYLFASLSETAPFLKEDPRLITWEGKYKSILDGMKIEDDQARFGNSPQMKVPLRNAP